MTNMELFYLIAGVFMASLVCGCWIILKQAREQWNIELARLDHEALPTAVTSLKRIAHTADFYLKTNSDPDAERGFEHIYLEASGTVALLEGRDE